MRIVDLAVLAIEACERAGVEYMLTGAFAAGTYGIPRSTKDVDLVLDLGSPNALAQIVGYLESVVEFGDQVQFDTLTWGKRHIGRTRESPFFKIELFELFDDPFVQQQFARKVRLAIDALDREAYLPTVEDVVVQKLRWARDKDLTDALDVLAVQEPRNLDMDYIRRWCRELGAEARLDETLARIPDI